MDDAFALEAERKTEKKFMSIILNNLHINYEGWRAELPKEEEEEEKGVAVEDEDEESETGKEESSDTETVSQFGLLSILLVK